MTNIRRHVFILLHFEIRKLNFKELPKVTELLATKPKFQTQPDFKGHVFKGTTCYLSKLSSYTVLNHVCHGKSW